MKKTKLHNVEVGKIFKIGETEFIKITDEYGVTSAVTKDIIFNSEFGKNNNFSESNIFEKLVHKFLPEIAKEIGMVNICDIRTDLTTLDGLKPYKELVSKISIPTFDFYRKYVEIFDMHKPKDWWWLATPETAEPHYDPIWIVCVSPAGNIGIVSFDFDFGVRPFLRFVSSISVSVED